MAKELANEVKPLEKSEKLPEVAKSYLKDYQEERNANFKVSVVFLLVANQSSEMIFIGQSAMKNSSTLSLQF